MKLGASSKPPIIEAKQDGSVKDKQYIDAMLEEYKTLRTESLNSINNRITILLSSFTSLSIITSATVIARLPSLIVGVVLAIAVPTLAKTLAMVWLAEYRRSQRAGAALVALERRINEGIGRMSLTWESNLRSRRMKISLPYTSTVVILLTIAYMSELLSLYYISRGARVLERWAGPDFPFKWLGVQFVTSFRITAGVTVALIILEVLSAFIIRSEWRQARSASL